jgi:hypothetical protein
MDTQPPVGQPSVSTGHRFQLQRDKAARIELGGFFYGA